MKEHTTLQTELKFYQKNKQEYLKSYSNQFVLIKGEELIGAFSTDAEAYRTGVQRFGNQPFFIKQVVEDESSVSYPAFTVGMLNARF